MAAMLAGEEHRWRRADGAQACRKQTGPVRFLAASRDWPR